MNTNIYTKKLLFYFRGEDSVENAILKITQLLSDINRDTTNTTNENIILNIFDPRQKGITFYKKQFNVYDKSDNFSKSLQAMEKQLTNVFTEIRLKDLASILEVNKNKANLDDVTLLKGVPRTVVSIDLYIGEYDLPDASVSLPRKAAKKVSSKPPKIIAEVNLAVAPISLPKAKAPKKVSSKTSSLKGLKQPVVASKTIPKLVIPRIRRLKVVDRVVGGLPIQMINGIDQSKSTSWTQLVSRYTPEMDNFVMRLPNLFLGALSKEPSNYIGMVILFMFYIGIYVLYCIIGIITYIKGVPLLLSNIQDIPLFNIFQDISIDSSIFENMFNILKNINESVPDILPRNY